MNNQRFEQRMAVRPLRNNEVWYRARLRNVAKTARASVEPELRKFIKEAVKPENQQMAHHLALTARNLIRNAAQKYMTSTDSTGIGTQASRIAARAASLNLDAVDRQFSKHLKQATGISAQFGKPDISHGKIVSTVHVGTGDTKSTAAPSDFLRVDWQRREYDREQYEAWLNYARDYSPDQPRDETGKWTSGGGGIEKGPPAPLTLSPKAYAEQQRAQLKMGVPLPKLLKEHPEYAKGWLNYTGQKTLTVYRGGDVERPIQPGDFVTTSREAAGVYGRHVTEHEVPAAHLRYVRGAITGDPKNLDVGGMPELIYAPKPTTDWLTGDFDPDQPRDETGKWTSGGTSGYTGGGVSSERRPVNPNDPRERQRAQADLAQSRGAAEAGAGSLPYTYTRRSGRDVEGVRVLGVPVRESWSLDQKVANELKAKGYASPDVHELDYNDPRAAQVFHDQIAQTKVGNRFAASVHVYSPEEYGQMRMFLSKDGKAGMALKPDGDMVSAFVHGDGPKGAIHTMLEVQKQAGGTKLDCFDTVLPAIYAPHGFTAVARTSWNDEYKPEGWDKNTYAKFNRGEPDVVFMARSFSAAPYRAGDGVRVDYDKAVSIQQAAVNQFTKRGAMSDWLTVDWRRVSEEQIERERIWKSVRDFDPDQPRDETGKWSGTGGGAIGARAELHAKLDKVYAKATATKAELDAHADAIATETGGVVAKAPLKGRERALEKVQQKYGGDVSRLKDVARNTVVVPAGNEEKALALLKSKVPGSVAEVKNPANDPLGYSGINVDVPTKAGLWAEMQINTPQMIYAKEPPQIARAIIGNAAYDRIANTPGLPAGGQGHKFYEQWRVMEPGSPGRDAVEVQSRNYYAAFRKAA